MKSHKVFGIVFFPPPQVIFNVSYNSRNLENNIVPAVMKVTWDESIMCFIVNCWTNVALYGLIFPCVEVWMLTKKYWKYTLFSSSILSFFGEVKQNQQVVIDGALKDGLNEFHFNSSIQGSVKGLFSSAKSCIQSPLWLDKPVVICLHLLDIIKEGSRDTLFQEVTLSQIVQETGIGPASVGMGMILASLLVCLLGQQGFNDSVE